VRAPGERAKVAVYSRERDVDPVGACVGMKGSRVQAIIRELRGEKIDIIEYSDDLVTFAQSALAPAKITRVSVKHEVDGIPHLDVIVEDAQLSLAIGKRGQNVRLASELIGCKIDIKSESAVKDEVADALAALLHVGEETAASRRRRRLTQAAGVDERSGAAARGRLRLAGPSSAPRWTSSPRRGRRPRTALGLRDVAQGEMQHAADIARRGDGTSGSGLRRARRGAPSKGPRPWPTPLHGQRCRGLPGPRRHPRTRAGGEAAAEAVGDSEAARGH
jgi:transcription antitermination factor NusA-like protein